MGAKGAGGMAMARWRDVPLQEEREAYQVGYGPVDSPVATWSVSAAMLPLAAADVDNLRLTMSGEPMWARQIGTYAQSDALLLGYI